MAKKKLDKDVILDDNVEAAEQDVEFTFDVQAFAPVFNKERKEYDMYVLKLNTTTNEVELEIEECGYTAIYRAASDLQDRQVKEMNRQLKANKK